MIWIYASFRPDHIFQIIHRFFDVQRDEYWIPWSESVHRGSSVILNVVSGVQLRPRTLRVTTTYQDILGASLKPRSQILIFFFIEQVLHADSFAALVGVLWVDAMRLTSSLHRPRPSEFVSSSEYRCPIKVWAVEFRSVRSTYAACLVLKAAPI